MNARRRNSSRCAANLYRSEHCLRHHSYTDSQVAYDASNAFRSYYGLGVVAVAEADRPESGVDELTEDGSFASGISVPSGKMRI